MNAQLWKTNYVEATASQSFNRLFTHTVFAFTLTNSGERMSVRSRTYVFAITCKY